MNKYLVWTILIILLSSYSCAANNSLTQASTGETSYPILVSSITPTLTATPTASPTATPLTKSNHTPYPTENGVSPEAKTHTPTNTPAPTLTPSPTSTLEFSERLKSREPSLEEIKTYLLNLPTEQFHGIWSDTDNVAYDVKTFKDYRGFTDNLFIIYKDVNGDQEEDLIVTDVLLTAIFLWSNEEYHLPYVILGSEWKYFPSSQTSFEDWTNDGVPEVIFNYVGDSGGTGARYASWSRYVIRCEQDDCHLIWDGLLTNIYSDYNTGGLTLFQSEIERRLENERLLLEKTTSGFSIYDLYFLSPEEYWNIPEALKVYTSTLESFVWDGSVFERMETEILDEPYIIEEDASLEADFEGNRALITYENNHAADGNNDFCQLFVNEDVVGNLFGCKRNFTTVEWRDITNDGQLEIVVKALSGAWPYAFSGTWPDVDSEDWYQLSDISCVHQHLLAYHWDGGVSRKIADVEGCVIQSDLFGVQLSDIDNDGQVEVLAGSSLFTKMECTAGIQYSCWYEFDPQIDTYKWNGTEFLLWDSEP